MGAVLSVPVSWALWVLWWCWWWWMHEGLRTHIQNRLPPCKHVLSHDSFAFRYGLPYVAGLGPFISVISLLLGESVGYTELGLVGHWVASWQRARVEGWLLEKQLVPEVQVSWWTVALSRPIRPQTKIPSIKYQPSFQNQVSVGVFPEMSPVDHFVTMTPVVVVTKLCLTLCDPVDCSTPGFPVLHHLLEFAQTHVHWVSDDPRGPLWCRGVDFLSGADSDTNEIASLPICGWGVRCQDETVWWDSSSTLQGWGRGWGSGDRPFDLGGSAAKLPSCSPQEPSQPWGWGACPFSPCHILPELCGPGDS